MQWGEEEEKGNTGERRRDSSGWVWVAGSLRSEPHSPGHESAPQHNPKIARHLD